MLNSELEQSLATRIHKHLGVDLQTLLQPISQKNPSGSDLKDSKVYSLIKEARKEDDASLPQGVWTHEFKKADWAKVTNWSVQALSEQSKDLQIAVWLLEAQLHRKGFAGLAPCFYLIKKLCETYWESLYPRMKSGDVEYRTNLFRWINQKLLPAVRLIPVTVSGRSEREMTWSDWEMALLQEKSKLGESQENKVTKQKFLSYVTSTPVEHYMEWYCELSETLITVDALVECLDKRCGNESPSLGHFRTLLEDIHGMMASQLKSRGVSIEENDSPVDLEQEENDGPQQSPSVLPSQQAVQSAGPPRSRQEAYVRLGEIADYIVNSDPHSPVPYLLKQAIYWGTLDTKELYEHLFIHCQGQINIFEVLGLDIKVDQST